MADDGRGAQGADLHRVAPHPGIPEDLPRVPRLRGPGGALQRHQRRAGSHRDLRALGREEPRHRPCPPARAPWTCAPPSSSTSATKATILLATEAAAEGINLQFCSLVINYDLPWNPQRIEQRIGRCHRYGQKHDVVVINFLNERNEADRRVLELLAEKFSLFSGVFGASDEVLGTIESGVDFEKRILAIYQECRTPEEIDAAFRTLQAEMDEQIRTRMDDTRRTLFEHFDEDVHQRLRLQLADAKAQLDRFGQRFWSLTRFMLDGRARFDDDGAGLRPRRPPRDEIATGRYHLISKSHPVGSRATRWRRGAQPVPLPPLPPAGRACRGEREGARRRRRRRSSSM